MRSSDTTVLALSAVAECDACRWRAAGTTGRAAGRRHHRETGHPVRVEIAQTVRFGDAEGRVEGQESLLEQLDGGAAA